MQRRDINKRLSFAEAENGQKDRNKEEVEEERELATKKGINKSRGRGEGGGGERANPEERGRKRERRVGSGPSALRSLVALLDQRPDLLLSQYTIRPLALESFYFYRAQRAGRCIRVLLFQEPLLSYRMDFRGVFVERDGPPDARTTINHLIR